MVNVYLICSETNSDSVYKVGFTKREVCDRIKEMKTGNAGSIYIVNVFRSKYGTKIEAFLKRKYKPYNVSGEWFNLPENEIAQFMENCQIVHDSFQIIENNTYLIDK